MVCPARKRAEKERCSAAKRQLQGAEKQRRSWRWFYGLLDGLRTVRMYRVAEKEQRRRKGERWFLVMEFC